MTISLTVRGPDGRVEAGPLTGARGTAQRERQADAAAAERLAAYLNRRRPRRSRAACVAVAPPPRSGIVI
jgi:hypothetical protein